MWLFSVVVNYNTANVEQFFYSCKFFLKKISGSSYAWGCPGLCNIQNSYMILP